MAAAGRGDSIAANSNILILRAEEVRLAASASHDLPDPELSALAPGDRVKLVLPQRILTRFVVLALLLPALLMILLASVGQALAPVLNISTDLAALAGIVTGCFCGALLARRHYRKRSNGGPGQQMLVLVPEA